MHKKLDVDATIQMVKNYLNHDDPEELKITAEYLNECTDVTGKKTWPKLKCKFEEVQEKYTALCFYLNFY